MSSQRASVGAGLRVGVTGAAGFIGRAVVARIDAGALGAVAELRLNDVQSLTHPHAVTIQGSYADQSVRDHFTAGGLDLLFHLASLPGGASEQNPALGRSVNLDGSIALIDTVAGPHAPVIIYASSIAAIGRADHPVTDATALRPTGSYGTHKAMLEFYLADLTRRGLIDARSLRPAGIVARPLTAYAGFATAWMSDLFHAAHQQRPLTIPARADAQLWLQSIDAVADNFIHAATLPAASLAPHRAWTLPPTVVRVDALVEALWRHTGHRLQITCTGGPTDQPPIETADAQSLGFRSDGDADALVRAVLARIKSIT